MNCFDDTPENDAPSKLCECGGNITLDKYSGTWFCDSCDWEFVPKARSTD